MRIAIAVILVIAGLAGCFGPPEIPEDAIAAGSEELPGVVLHAWTDVRQDRQRLQGAVHNGGDEVLEIRHGCGHPWNTTLLDEAGRSVAFREQLERPGCGALWDQMRPGTWKDILYSWDGQDHDPENGTAKPMPAGNYTWVIRFETRDDRAIEVRLAILRD